MFFPTLAVLGSTLFTAGALDGTCWLLNRAGFSWRQPSMPITWPLPAKINPAARFEIPTTAHELPLLPKGPEPAPTPASEFDESRKIPRGYGYQENFINLPRPNQKARAVLSNSRTGEVYYDVTYTIDPRGRRWTPQDRPSRRKNSLLVMGCSYVFGDGLADQETLPAYLARYLPDYRVYNLGFHGYSPASLWVRSHYEGLFAGIRDPNGIGLYLYLDEHLDRAFGGSTTLLTWRGNLPIVDFDRSGSAALGGSYFTNHPRRLAF